MSRRYFGTYTKTHGMKQKDMVELYSKLGKSIEEMQDLLACPRASIRGRLSEIKHENRLHA